MNRFVGLFRGCCTFLACSSCGSSPAPANSPPTPPPAQQPVAPSAAVSEPAAGAGQGTAGAEPSLSPTAVCGGVRLNLDRLIEARHCDLRTPPRPPPPEQALGLRVSPSLVSVASGATGALMLTLINQRSESLALELDVSCGKEVTFGVRVFDQQQRRVDQVESPCRSPLLHLCGSRAMRVVLEPSGRLEVPLKIAATQQSYGEDCRLRPLAPLPPGTYTVHVMTPFEDPLPGADEARRRFGTAMLRVTK